jgi:cell division protein FtsQ
MAFNLKKTIIVTVDLLLAVYLLLAITAFNRPDELSNVCSEVNIDIQDGIVKGFMNANEVRSQLQRAKLYPQGDPMNQISTRAIEEALLKNPFVEEVQCYKTQTGRVNIQMVQRLPVVRVKADNGDDYYVDEHGNIMPTTSYASDLVVATGNISKKYAQKELTPIGNYLIHHPLWRSQIQQINVLADGTVEAVPKVGDHIIYLGDPVNLDKKFNRLEKFYRYGLSHAGWNKYSYINLEFNNQIICKKRKL